MGTEHNTVVVFLIDAMERQKDMTVPHPIAPGGARRISICFKCAPRSIRYESVGPLRPVSNE